MSDKQIIHVRPARSESGRDVERHEREARRWHEAGYATAPVPDDPEHPHPYGKPCPVCNRK